MIQIGNVIVSLDVLEKKFSCDLAACRGICCLEGDAGAPLEEGEVEKISKNYPGIKPYMKQGGVKAVEEQGYMVYDIDGDMVTPLIEGMECAYSIIENGNYWCAIEKAWTEGNSDFRKPESCYLYPIRIEQLGECDALNYHKWKVCACARTKGERENTLLYRFLKAPLIAKYGEAWYEELEMVAKEWEKEKGTVIY
ncbi:DUF3109 family protein [Porphyromonadaceae bacterium OttesenSCG-928-L07]|nr:DUF3109 family protein [Porphyromonadaceae bacterium OttesenSCG-928-L07]MDL2251605.1 DUF3109 family protein [Odoribacter sp. OttesenSCG-928-J03]MDL2330695.1 DUF3109 family protein [Odoribacter sp. OttesenSCG-928-A06]